MRLTGVSVKWRNQIGICCTLSRGGQPRQRGPETTTDVRKAIRAAGARLLFLPPYSPDLNPIEQVFAKLKHLLRRSQERTTEDTWRRIGTLLDTFTARECNNYLVNSGDAAT